MKDDPVLMNNFISYNAEVELVGVSRNIQRIRVLIDQVAETSLNVIVCGETGVGKELVVSSLYQKSNRLGKPFVKVNCAALPDTLLESEMFGYERGAFTGAIRTRRANLSRPMEACCFWMRSGHVAAPAVEVVARAAGWDFTRWF